MGSLQDPNEPIDQNGVRGAYAQEMYTINPQDLEQLENDGGQVYGFIMLLDPLKRLSKTVEPESEEEFESELKEPESESVADVSNWVAKDDASITTAKDEKKKTKSKTQLYFANQVIPNACATQAVLSVIMNAPSSLDIGPVLANFKDFTRDFSPIDKGLAMTNCKDLRTNHNSLAERLEQEPSSLQKYLHNAIVHEATEESLHYIAYVPVNGYIWELDGLEPQPIRRRPFGVLNKKEEDGQQAQPQEEEDSPKSWLTVTGEVMTERIRLYPAGEERFVLFAIVKDPLVVLEEKLATEKQRAQGAKMEGILDQDAGTSPSASNESISETPSPPSGEQVSLDTVAELERMIESLKRERKQEQLDIALKTADYWPAINMFLRHLVGEGKVNKKTGKLITDQEDEAVPADADMKMDQVTDQEEVPVEAAKSVTDQEDEAVPADADMKMDQVTGQEEVPVEAAKPVDTKAPKRARKKTETKGPAKVEVAKDEESANAGEPVAPERPARPEPDDLVPTEPSTSKAKDRRRKQKTLPLPVIESEQDHPMEVIQEPLSEPMPVSPSEPIQVSRSEPTQVSPVEPVPETPETGRGKRRRIAVKPLDSVPVPETLATGRGRRTNFATNPFDSVPVPETLAMGRGTKTKFATKPFDSASGKKRATSQDPPWSTPPPPPPPLPQPSSAKKRQAAVPTAPPRTRRAKKQECHPPVNPEPLGASPDGMEIDESPAVAMEPLGSSSSELSSAEDYTDDSDLELMQSSREERRSHDTQQQGEIKPLKDAQQKGELEPPKEAQHHDIDMPEAQQQGIERTEAPQQDTDQTQAPQQNIKLTEAQQQGIKLTGAQSGIKPVEVVQQQREIEPFDQAQ
ncbi:Ubiquitin carboxyl-terminal hydrolase bap1 [Mortierella antarctica]|nr:Ubiquitin carboxyl-terminal hydrolase bap1 [Mortierella antarctica]